MPQVFETSDFVQPNLCARLENNCLENKDIVT